MKKPFRMSRLLFISFAVTLFVLLTIIVLSWSVLRRETASVNAQKSADALTDASGALSEKIDSLKSGCALTAAFGEIQDFSGGDEATRLERKSSVRTMLSALVYYESGAVSAYIFTADGARISACPVETEYPGVVPHRVSQQLVLDYAPASPFRQQVVTRCYRVAGHIFYAILTPIYRQQTVISEDNYLGALALVLDASHLASLLPDSAAGRMTLFDSEGMILQDNAFDDQTNTLSSGTIPGTDWIVSIQQTDTAADSGVIRAGRLCAVFGISAALLLLLLFAVEYNHIIGPVQRLTAQISAITSEAGHIVTPAGSCREVHTLSDSMDQMLTRLNQMNEEMVRDRLGYLEDRITFLQAQINPHALYNNFECIRGMAARGNTEKIREMTTCLARMYRYCCKGDILVTLKEEADSLQYYSRVLELRYDNRFKIKMDLEETTLSLPVPRMILQPLAENAVIHGLLAAGKEEGFIQIRSRLENNKLLLTIEDNGCGMTDEVLARCNGPIAAHDDGTHSHIGITNVLRRLMMIYGTNTFGDASSAVPCPFGHFENHPEGGLIVTLILPTEGWKKH